MASIYTHPRTGERIFITAPIGTSTNRRHALVLRAIAGGWFCFYCGDSLGPHGEHYTIDHVLPLSRGGARRLDNERLACRSCNSSKGASTPAEWMDRLEAAA